MVNLTSPADVRLLLLASLLALAAWHDLRTRRIPNRLVASGAIAALLLHLLEQWQGNAGLLDAVLLSAGGFLAGMLLLLPLYILRAMGAGDVKLMAMVGAFLGPTEVLGATLLTMFVGGIIAVLLALRSRQLGKVLGNVLQILWGTAMGNIFRPDKAGGKIPASSGQFPYAFAIGAGTLMQLALAGSPVWHTFS
jgi:prepilin peptidase CpaA